ncbi:cobaltochelatase subunit CobN [Methanoregula formicica]|uniref:Magnesium chelatase, H subunit n=1 Tax=Methanoregula formicica (strain DSM 22288 / NBRC 105244 / SMSP) TaxID=593750 RepID=L0HFP5_METFS|nr:cobaltochelatase subunit CobN [Methanoregula formicica]AGB01904.1 magnesium chelatase, H subunit [Methanoregula formicica SMSP]
MKITSVMWGSYAPVMKRAAETCAIRCAIYPTRILEESPEKREEAVASMKDSDVILLYHTSDLFWEELDREVEEIKKTVPVISLGPDPSFWARSTVRPEIVTTCHRYITNNGDENFKNLLRYIDRELTGTLSPVDPPADVPWEGLYHPEAPQVFSGVDEYLAWYGSRAGDKYRVALVFSRTSWAAGNVALEDQLIASLEAEGLAVIPVFTYAIRDDALGARGMDEVVSDYLVRNGTPLVDAMVKLIPFLFGSVRGSGPSPAGTSAGIGLLRSLDIPVFSPVVTMYMDLAQWQASDGLSRDVGWSVALPEFEGVIEPVFAGTSRSKPDGGKTREAVPDRCAKIARRVRKWIMLAKKPAADRKVAFILNNNPCAGTEANIGGGSNLDTLESVARILARMAEAGYRVSPPASGKELVDAIQEKKALSEFRWTTAQDIVACGGALDLMDLDTYLPYFRSLPPVVQKNVAGTWGEPPGEGMVLGNRMLITGISLGNATVHVQPKRGCYGSRCDGTVCKILHDPKCPPPHQYLATYYWLDQVRKADLIVHVGTHGSLEFLPGKGTGLSQECFPDIAAGNLPCLYIYNSDNPAEGTTAKRRGYAVLVDHMQAVMTGSGLYDELLEIDSILSEYETARHDPARAHALQHQLTEALIRANLDKDMHLDHGMPLDVMVAKAHEALSKIRNTRIPSGMHVFGSVPAGAQRVEFVSSVIRFDNGPASPRRLIAGVIGSDLDELLEGQDRYSEDRGMSYGALLEEVDRELERFVAAVLDDPAVPAALVFGRRISEGQVEALDIVRDRVIDISRRIDESRETDSLLHGMDGRYVPAGPSGQITRGHEDVLPTGRNFYSLDPHRVPTQAAWRVGQRLADALIEKYSREEGTVPENIAFYWMAGDIMASDGEMFAEMLWLIGARPVWQKNGQVRSFEIVPLHKLGHPRIDITVRTTGILRDNFASCYELLDDAIRAVAALDEPSEKNFVRRHTQKSMVETGAGFRDATIRIFSSRPGSYASGVNLAVLSSAWKTQADLADIFVAYNGYAYGRDIAGKDAHEHLAASLSTVSVTFNKIQSDEHDLLGCCCYFGTHGGFTAAARHYSGNNVKPYYGDTREPENVEVRDLGDEIRRVVRTRLLNPKWIYGMKDHGYKGASDIMKRVTRVYGWSASTQEVDDWIFNDIADTFVNNEEMRDFFEQNNPYALEEIARRLLEAHTRSLWDADPRVLDELKKNYLEIESWMEDRSGQGDYQGGTVDVVTMDDNPLWGDAMKDILEKVHARHQR